MSKFFLVLATFCACITAYCAPLYLQDKFQKAQAGDYIVTEQDGAYCLLLLRSLSSHQIILEEVLIPSEQLNLKTIEWHTFLKQNAPGHTSWTAYEIDLKNGTLLECFSYSKNGWIYLDEHEQLFSKLFSLSFTPVTEPQRKKIGPQPHSGEADHRRPWNPPLFLEGKKNASPVFEVMQTRWPDDGSKLALCNIELYFDASHPNFAFPYWIEIKSPHYAFKVRAIASGHNLTSPMQAGIPHRPPELMGFTQKTSSSWDLVLRAPLYHDSIHLFAIDLTAESRKTIAVPHQMKRQENEQLTLHINPQDLKTLLQTDHRYRWLIVSEKTPTTYVESEEIFTWK